MINRKCNCENEFSIRKLSSPASSENIALAKKYNCCEKAGIFTLKSRGSEKVTYSKSNFIRK